MSRDERATLRDVRFPLSGSRGITLGELIGQGARAVVFRGELDSGFGVRRPVAVKVFDADRNEEPELFERLRDLVQRTALVRHPSVVAVHEFGVMVTGRPFLLAELTEGTTLARLLALRSGAGIPLDVAVPVAIAIGDAVHATWFQTRARGMPVVHGELSAHQVLVGDSGELKVSDFGISNALCLARATHRLPTEVTRLASMAPEVAQGNIPDARADVFSFGILLQELLVGPRFLPDEDFATMVRDVREGRVHQRAHSNLPTALRAVVTRAIEPEPAWRFPLVGDVVEALREVARDLGLGDPRMAFARLLELDLSSTGVGRRREPSRPTLRSETGIRIGRTIVSESEVHRSIGEDDETLEFPVEWARGESFRR